MIRDFEAKYVAIDIDDAYLASKYIAGPNDFGTAPFDLNATPKNKQKQTKICKNAYEKRDILNKSKEAMQNLLPTNFFYILDWHIRALKNFQNNLYHHNEIL